MHQPPVRFTYRLLSYLISTIIAGQPLLPAVGAVITPQNGAGMDKAANGVPVVNIATPNGAGISHNRFTDYNVGKEGLILNNATGKLNPTQFGGLIQNNPNLKAGGEAKGIINEVTGGNRSLLQGYTEVAGKAANVIVANPYGITCDGCGFINTPHATLTTGRPVMNADGSLQALEVTEGSITINGAGLDGTRSDAVSIIARATEVNAALHAKDLTVTAGANRVTADGRVSALKGEGNVPKVAVDIGALGGMYARRIHLTSTESGVGVNLGNLYARDGDITLDASGRLTVNNSLATGAVTAKGQGVTLTGDHKAGGNLSVSSRSDIVLSNGTLNSDKDLSLTAGGRITQQNEKLTAGRDVTLAAKNITQDTASQINAARDIWIYNARTCAIYNPLYDLMYRAGVPLRNMRVCEPFGPEQHKGLWLYHVLEPETWARMCERVSGAASGALYANESGAYFALRKRISKPAHHTWRSYAMFLLDVMPERTAEHYRSKIAVYLRWYQTRGFPDDIPDEQENDLGSRDIPSWRRICKTLIKNDFWCRTLSFSPNKPRHYERYLQRMKERRKEWGIL